MSEFSISHRDFNDGEEIPKKFGYKHGNEIPDHIHWSGVEYDVDCIALIMDDPDAMGAVGKVWVHWLEYHDVNDITTTISGRTDFDEIGYGGPAPPDKRHTYVFKAYALDTMLHLKEGFSKQELEDAMQDHIITETKLTGTFAP